MGVKLCVCSRVGKGSFKSWQPRFCSTKVWFKHAICCISCFSQRCDFESGEQLKKRRDQKEAAKWGGGSLPGPPSRSPKQKSPVHVAGEKSPVHVAGESSQILRGGPKTWPLEVVEHVHTMLDLGWSSSKVANHYSLLVFGITPQQIDLVRNAPTSKRAEAETRRANAWPEELGEHVRKLILEGKTNTAILNHYCLSNTNTSDAHIQSIRTAIEKEAWFNASGAAAASPKKSASKIRPPPLSKQVCMLARTELYCCMGER